MKIDYEKKDLLKIFGTEHPSIEEYLNWVTENNPKTFQLWDPPLYSQEKAILFDDELTKKPQGRNSFGSISVDEEEWNSYSNKYLPIEGVALILDSVREAKEENISSENLLLCVNELEKLLRNSINDSWNHCFLLHGQVIKVLKKHGISLNEIINSSKKRIWEKKDELFNNLSEWTIGGDSIGKIDSPISIRKDWTTDIANGDEYDILRNAIIQDKIEDMNKNPKNWKIFKASGMNSPWSGSATYIERKDGKVKIYKTDLNQQQWEKIEKALESNFFFCLFCNCFGNNPNFTFFLLLMI